MTDVYITLGRVKSAGLGTQQPVLRAVPAAFEKVTATADWSVATITTGSEEELFWHIVPRSSDVELVFGDEALVAPGAEIDGEIVTVGAAFDRAAFRNQKVAFRLAP